MNLAFTVTAVVFMKAVFASLKETCARMKRVLGMGIALISITSLNVYALAHMKGKVVKY